MQHNSDLDFVCFRVIFSVLWPLTIQQPRYAQGALYGGSEEQVKAFVQSALLCVLLLIVYGPVQNIRRHFGLDVEDPLKQLSPPPHRWQPGRATQGFASPEMHDCIGATVRFISLEPQVWQWVLHSLCALRMTWSFLCVDCLTWAISRSWCSMGDLYVQHVGQKDA